MANKSKDETAVNANPEAKFENGVLTVYVDTEARKVAFRAFNKTNICAHYTSSRIGGVRVFFNSHIEIDVPPSLNLDGMQYELKDINTREVIKKGTISYGK